MILDSGAECIDGWEFMTREMMSKSDFDIVIEDEWLVVIC